MLDPIPLSLYIHIPWCVKKCPYCDFNSHELKGGSQENEYVDALIKDLENDLPSVWGRRISSIFFGGGTPSLFSPEAIERILQTVSQLLPFGPETEITLEANPGTVEQENFDGFHRAGVNRLSIGVQSFHEHHLKKLGRIHDSNEAKKAAISARKAGIDNFNLDLMFGLPDQTIDEALDDLRSAIALNPNHISWYQLTLEPHTPFHHNPPKLPNDDRIWEMQTQGQALLKKSGYEQYEISAYSKPKKQCLHNLNYWEFGDYLGIGAGAHGKITSPADNSVTRTWKAKHPKDYLNAEKGYIAGTKVIPEKELPSEFMMNALRLNQSIPKKLFADRTHLSFDNIEKTIQDAVEKKLLTENQNEIQTSALGRRYLNDLISLFL